MEAFSYLSVLLSIIIGLAMTQVLQGYRALLLSRRRVKLYFPPLAWSAYILLMATQSWWSSFGMADRTEWTFATFAIILLQTVLLYMMAALVLPDVPPDQSIDLEAHYFREVTPFFATAILMLGTSLTKGIMLDGRLPQPDEAFFHGLFAVLAAIAIASRRRWLHHLLTAATGVLLFSYIALLFARL